MKIFIGLFSLIIFSSGVTAFVRAASTEPLSGFEAYNLGEINAQDGWSVTNYHGNADSHISVSAREGGESKYAEIINHDSILATRHIPSSDHGTLQFRMRHNKSGLLYVNALSSDAGGQLLFSIQFTESKGILLEEGDKQISLLSDYDRDQWYAFTIDFDNKINARGSFKIKINDKDYGEYEYVNSESNIFDLSQITFGSESDGGQSISSFAFISVLEEPVVVVEEMVEEEASTTSIQADLDTNQTFTASVDPIIIPEAISPADSSVSSQTAEENTDTSITAPLDPASASTVTANIDGDVPQTATSTEDESITAPLDETDASATTTTTF